MPEGPEVETLRRRLERTLPGRRIARSEITLPKLFRSADGFAPADLVDREVVALRRRAKYLVVDLSGDLALIVHLKMSGQLVHVGNSGAVLAAGGHPQPPFGAPLPHRATHAVFRLDDRSTLYYTDIRQFGRLWLVRAEQVGAFFAGQQLGPEVLEPEFSADYLKARLARSRVPLKPFLLDQSNLAGLGSIYVDNALGQAKLSPERPADSVDEPGAVRLHYAIRETIRRAVAEGVVQMDHGRNAVDQDYPQFHGRAGKPCPHCGAPIARKKVRGRTTYYCERCQA